jgi:hypothetical protein
MVHIISLRKLDRTTAGVGIPRSELRELELLEESDRGDEIEVKDQQFALRPNGDGTYNLEPLPPESPHASD